MFNSPRLNAVRDWIIVLLVRKFETLPGPQMEVDGEEIEIEWTNWINERADLRPRPSNVARRFRELREQWRDEETKLGENNSRLRRQAGIIGITRLNFTPLKLSLTQELSFTEKDCSLIDTGEKQRQAA